MFDTRASTSLYSNATTLSWPLQHHRHQHFASRTASRRSHGVARLDAPDPDLASSTLSARRPIDCDAAGPAGDGILGGSRSVVDGCARGLTPSGPAGHGPPPGAARQKAWRGCGLVGRIAGMPTNLTIQTLLGDVVGFTGHRYAVTDNAGNKRDTRKIITNPSAASSRRRQTTLITMPARARADTASILAVRTRRNAPLMACSPPPTRL